MTSKVQAVGTLVFLPRSAGGFDLSGCPNPAPLGHLIALAMNSRDDLM